MFWNEFCNNILPYYLEQKGQAYEWDRIDYLWNQGPYELNPNISIKKGDVVIDCGANIGQFSAVAAKKGAIVYAIEGSSWVRSRYLNQTAKLNEGIIVIPYAVGECKGSTKFEYSTSKKADGGRMCLDNDRKKCEIVQIISIDEFVEENFIEKVSFIKGNLWGGESRMLKGAENTIKKYKPIISICDHYNKDDMRLLEHMLLKFNKDYIIEHKYQKMYAYVPPN